MWPYPRVVAHRGGGTLAPENTFAALRCGLAYGFHAVEFDVMLSSDGEPVILHDDVLGRTVPGSGSVGDFSAEELAGMNAGRWFSPQFDEETVPRFEQFVDYCKSHRIWMNVEIKPVPGFETETGYVVAAATREYFVEELGAADPALLPLLASFSTAALKAAREAAPELPRALLVDAVPDDWHGQTRALGAVALHANHQHLTEQQAHAIKQAGLGLFCYTVNEPGRAAELLGWGVDGFCTDRIDTIGPTFGQPQPRPDAD